MPPRSGWGQAAERIGTVLVAEGTAEIQTQGSTTWEVVRFRDSIFHNDTVRTGAGGKVKVLLRDDSILTLAEHSQLQVTDFLLTSQQRRMIVTLAVGTVRVIAERFSGANSVTEVHTPNAVVGAEGTTFMVVFIPPDTTDVISLEGVVTVRNRVLLALEIQPLPANFRTRVVGTAPPTRAAEVSTDTLRQLAQEVRVVEQSPQEVLTTEKLQALDTSQSLRAPTVDTRVLESPPMVVPAPVPPAPAAVVVREQPAPDPGSSVQTSVVTPDTSIVVAPPRVRVRLRFPGR
jgi:hypothetical protein